MPSEQVKAEIEDLIAKGFTQEEVEKIMGLSTRGASDYLKRASATHSESHAEESGPK